MAVTSSRQWDALGGAPQVWVKGPVPFVPPLPRCAFQTFPPQHWADLSAPYAFTRATAPIVINQTKAPTGNFAFPPQLDDANGLTNTSGRPWSWTQSVVPPQLPINPVRGALVFANVSPGQDWNSPFSLTRSTLAIPTLQVLSQPAFKSSFVRAGGWWDILSDAPFFFLAGYSTQNVGPPPMKAFAADQPDSLAPYSFTRGSTLTQQITLVTVSRSALGLQQPADAAPFSLSRGLVPAPVPNPPFGASITTRQLEADIASFTFVTGLYTTTAFTPAFQPASVGKAFAYQHPADPAPFSLTNFVRPVPGQIPPFGASVFAPQLTPDAAPFSYTTFTRLQLSNVPPFGRNVFAPQHVADAAPFKFATHLKLQFSNITPSGTSITTSQLDDGKAPFTYVRWGGLFTPKHIAGSVFSRLHDDPAAPFAFFRSRGIVQVVLTPSSVTDDAFGLQQPADSAAWSFSRNGIILPNLNRPAGGITVVSDASAYDWEEVERPFSFLQPGLMQETVPQVSFLRLDQAIYNLVNAGLEVFVQYQASNSVPYNYVISQNPPAGTSLSPWTVVTLTASSGPVPLSPGTTTVPNVVGMTAYSADQALFNASLSMGQYQWTASIQTAGTVVSQSPAAGTVVPVSTIIQLTLSQGPVKIVPPIISPP